MLAKAHEKCERKKTLDALFLAPVAAELGEFEPGGGKGGMRARRGAQEKGAEG
jgi:hypothetical protein